MSQTSTVVVGPQLFPLAKNHITVVVSVSESEISLPKASVQPQHLCQCLKPVCLRCQHSHSSHVSVCLRHLHSHSSHVSDYIGVWTQCTWRLRSIFDHGHMTAWSDGNRASLKPTLHDQSLYLTLTSWSVFSPSHWLHIIQSHDGDWKWIIALRCQHTHSHVSVWNQSKVCSAQSQ